MRQFAMTTSLCLVMMSCSSDSDPFNAVGGTDAAVSVDAQPGTIDAGPSFDGLPLTCADRPTRMVVLGDSITACSTIGGKEADGCSAKLFHDYVETTYAAELSYENVAVPGAVTAEVTGRQLRNVETGVPGHALVLIYIGGNDLQPYIFISDQAAQSRFTDDMPAILDRWNKIVEFFNDAENFPDGVTLMMNRQYNPFDDCTASPYNLSPAKIGMLTEFNAHLTRIAESHQNIVITDQHTPYLGHGHHYDIASCPHYDASAEPWMQDLIHPNAAGHANLAEQWQGTADRIYASCE